MPQSNLTAAQKEAARVLAGLFRRNGFLRTPDPDRLRHEGWQRYKKGYEVRLVARSAAELRVMRRLLRTIGLKPGRSFAKGAQQVQPVYGRQSVDRFLELVRVAPKRRRRTAAG